jgi:hypothetical protein
MPVWLQEVCKQLPLAAAAILGWWNFFFARRDKRAAESKERKSAGERAAAEAELLKIKRRAPATGPYFVASDRRFTLLTFIANKNGGIATVRAGGDQMLDYRRSEVPPLRPGQVVFFILENDGAAATEVFFELDGMQATMEEAQNAPCVGLLVLMYPYDPAKSGQRQTLIVRFMTYDGARDEHRYEIIHGQRWLRRIEPN